MGGGNQRPHLPASLHPAFGPGVVPGTGAPRAAASCTDTLAELVVCRQCRPAARHFPAGESWLWDTPLSRAVTVIRVILSTAHVFLVSSFTGFFHTLSKCLQSLPVVQRPVQPPPPPANCGRVCCRGLAAEPSLQG